MFLWIMHDHLFSDAIQKLLEVKEVALQEAAEAIDQEGLTGRNTPAVYNHSSCLLYVSLNLTCLHQL